MIINFYWRRCINIVGYEYRLPIFRTFINFFIMPENHSPRLHQALGLLLLGLKMNLVWVALGIEIVRWYISEVIFTNYYHYKSFNFDIKGLPDGGCGSREITRCLGCLLSDLEWNSTVIDCRIHLITCQRWYVETYPPLDMESIGRIASNKLWGGTVVHSRD